MPRLKFRVTFHLNTIEPESGEFEMDWYEDHHPTDQDAKNHLISTKKRYEKKSDLIKIDNVIPFFDERRKS